MAGKSKLARCSGAGEKKPKRARCSCAGEKKPKRARCSGAVGEDQDRDRLSSLPDDILIDNILSRLPMLEAQRTGILARRWRYLWRYVPCLDLDGSQKLVRFHPDHTIMSGAVCLDEPASEYAKWVDQTIKAYRGTSALRNFRVLYHLGASSARNIDSWLEFSLRRGVEVLELDCCCLLGFPEYRFLSVEPSMYPNIRLLKSLTLRAVEVPHHGDLSGLLSACEFLERLHLTQVTLTKLELKVKGPVSRLKHILIDCCPALESIAIDAPTPDLVSFINPLDIHEEVAVDIEHAPRLVDLGVRPFNTDGTFHRLLRYLSQLEALHLLFFSYDMKDIDLFRYFPVLSRLKHLELRFMWSDGSKFLRQKLLCLESLIAIAPSLQHLTLTVRHLGWSWALEKQLAKTRLELPVPVIQISGFDGRKVECQVVLLLVKASPALEKLIIDRREPLYRGFMLNPYTYSEKSIKRWENFVRKEIEPELPNRVKLVLISSYLTKE